jgi:hypothetical protein
MTPRSPRIVSIAIISTLAIPHPTAFDCGERVAVDLFSDCYSDCLRLPVGKDADQLYHGSNDVQLGTIFRR